LSIYKLQLIYKYFLYLKMNLAEVKDYLWVDYEKALKLIAFEKLKNILNQMYNWLRKNN